MQEFKSFYEEDQTTINPEPQPRSGEDIYNKRKRLLQRIGADTSKLVPPAKPVPPPDTSMIGRMKTFGKAAMNMVKKPINAISNILRKYRGKNSWYWRALELQRSGALGERGVRLILPPGAPQIPGTEDMSTENDYQECIRELRNIGIINEDSEKYKFDFETPLEDKLGHDQIINLNPGEIEAAIEDHVKSRKPLMVWGAPGIGKTQVVEGLARKINKLVLVIELSKMDHSDFMGLPVVYKSEDVKGQEEHKAFRSNWALPDIWPTTNGPGGRGGIIFFDEFNLANPEIVNNCHKLLTDNEMQNYHVPSQWVIIAAGNREKDNPTVRDMSAPLRNRMAFVNMITTVDDFEKWATSPAAVEKIKKHMEPYEEEEEVKDKQGNITGYRLTGHTKTKEFTTGTGYRLIDPTVIGFLHYKPSALWDAKHATGAEGETTAPSPRSWANASGDAIRKEKELGRRLTEAEIRKIFREWVGDAAAQEYATFREDMAQYNVRDVAEILVNPDAKIRPPLANPKAPHSQNNNYNQSKLYAMCALLLSLLKKENPEKNIEPFVNAIKWTTHLDDGEPAIYIVRNIIANKLNKTKILQKDEIFDALEFWEKKYGPVIGISDAETLYPNESTQPTAFNAWLVQENKKSEIDSIYL